MVLTFNIPNTAVIASGLYEATLTDVQVAEGPTGAFLMWMFKIKAGDTTVVLGAPTSVKIGSGTKARRYAETLLGHPLHEGDTVAVEVLCGARCMVLVTVAQRDGAGPVNRIENVLAPFPESSNGEVPF